MRNVAFFLFFFLFVLFLFCHRDVFIRLCDEPSAPEEIGDTCKQTSKTKMITDSNSNKNKSLCFVFNKDAEYARNGMWS